MLLFEVDKGRCRLKEQLSPEPREQLSKMLHREYLTDRFGNRRRVKSETQGAAFDRSPK